MFQPRVMPFEGFVYFNLVHRYIKTGTTNLRSWSSKPDLVTVKLMMVTLMQT